MSSLYENDDSAFIGDSDCNFAVDKGEKVLDHVDDKLARSDDLNVDLNQHGKLGSPSLPTDFTCDISESSHGNLPAEFGHDDVRSTKFDSDHERTESPLKNNHYQGEMDELHGSNFLNSPQFKAQTFHSEKGTEDSAHSQESPLRAQGNQGEQMESDCVYNEIEGEGTDAGQLLPSLRSQGCKNELKDGKSPTENRKPDMIHSGMQSPKRTPRQSRSPVIVREMLVSPERSSDLHYSPNGDKTLSSQQGCQDPSYSPRSQRQKHSSPERNGLVERVPSQDHTSPTMKTSVSPPGFQKGSRHKHDSSRKRISTSPKTSHSPPKHRRRDRSVSRSPIRRRDRKRDYRDRSRSRSPYSRDRYRSPRRRYSPRRRSSPPGYHSHHRSPRRRPWSPPRNRKTGVGLPGRNLFVAGFSFLTTERDLERKFSRFGHVRDVRIVRDKRSGDSRGFGFLSLERDEDADAAIRALDETEWNGRIILVEKSKSSGP
ncbi:serine/arginine repetitive matrix protein 2-like isoform X2 [Quercus lobata]|uniref:RRM domain-containing protein n=1 Tax=Quercus lobata TaxID=97700 RepID=A0A7N2M8D9_QUELO|nr:serine/arginine repetitive matrix protein 2-like isoform X2 [Quercus lobata]